MCFCSVGLCSVCFCTPHRAEALRAEAQRAEAQKAPSLPLLLQVPIVDMSTGRVIRIDLPHASAPPVNGVDNNYHQVPPDLHGVTFHCSGNGGSRTRRMRRGRGRQEPEQEWD